MAVAGSQTRTAPSHLRRPARTHPARPPTRRPVGVASEDIRLAVVTGLVQ